MMHFENSCMCHRKQARENEWLERLILLPCSYSFHFFSRSFPAAQTTKHLGRKPSMLISAVLYLIGVVLATAARKRFTLWRFFEIVKLAARNIAVECQQCIQEILMYNGCVSLQRTSWCWSWVECFSASESVLPINLLRFTIRKWLQLIYAAQWTFFFRSVTEGGRVQVTADLPYLVRK